MDLDNIGGAGEDGGDKSISLRIQYAVIRSGAGTP